MKQCGAKDQKKREVERREEKKKRRDKEKKMIETRKTIFSQIDFIKEKKKESVFVDGVDLV